MGDTQQNLKDAFAGESQANRRYLFFADKAESESYPAAARLFRAAAEAETVHAKNHLEALKGIGSTKDNLGTAVNGENYEFTQMYPAFIEQAKAEGNGDAEVSFDLANQVEQIHHSLYQRALGALDGSEPLADEPYFVCQRCGNTVGGEAPSVCPICGAPRQMFKQVD